MGDIETVEYQKATPKGRVDLDIEDVTYTPVNDKNKIKLSGKQEVLTPRGEKFEQVKTQVGEQKKNTISKFVEWRKAQQAKRAAVQVQATPSTKKKIAYVNGKPVIVDAKPRAVAAPRPPSPRAYRAPYQQANYTAQLQAQREGLPPDISGGMRPPDITGGGAMAPRIISEGSGIPRIIGDSPGGAKFMDNLGSGGSTFDKLGLSGGKGGNAFDKLGLGGMNTKGGFFDSLKSKGKRGLW